MSRFDLHRPTPLSASSAAASMGPSTPTTPTPPSPLSPGPEKPKGGARVLSFVLQAVVMAVALALFFVFAGVAAVVLLHICMAGSALRRRRASAVAGRQYPDRDVPAPAPARPGLSASELKRLPWFRFSGRAAVPCRSRLPPPQDCAVCLDVFRERERCRALPSCGHVLHAHCVDRWLVRTPACPICRTRVDTAAAVPEPVNGRPFGWD